ncbi:MAG: hemolysin family protein [Candidatus Kapabacteria bacterium]|jgi:CBS domain containing-hemolysin-like protein|nr:hemolysin family protein [Candidatus Kapabacteria bacterium]
MEIDSCCYTVIIITFLNSFFAASEFALSKFKAYCDENQISSKGFVYKTAMQISQNFRKYYYTFFLINYIIPLVTGMLIIICISAQTDELLIFNSKIESYILFVSLTAILYIPLALTLIGMLPRFISGKMLLKTAAISSIPVIIVHTLTYPLRIIMKLFESLLQKFLDSKPESADYNSEEELRQLIEESAGAGNIEEDESKLIENIFEFKETTVKQVMTPRKNIVAVSDDWSENEILETVALEGYSRYPVFMNNIDSIRGILHSKDLVALMMNKKLIVMNDIIRPVIFVNEDKYIDELLREFQKTKIQMAVVLDNFGGTSGIITMEDILEEIVGEIHDEHDEVNKIIENIGEYEYIADASASVRDLNQILPMELPESDEYESLGGLIITETENIPENNDIIEMKPYRFVILSRTRTKIEKVKIIYEPVSSEE